jgi:hypothetical protein
MGPRAYPLVVAAAVIAAAAVLLVVLKLSGVNLAAFTGDPTATAGLAPWNGAFSTFGLLLIAASVGAFVLAGSALAARGSDRATFFFATAALLGYLLADDAFLLHEYVGPRVLGVSQKLVYALTGLAGLAWVARFRAEIASSEVRLLAVALAGASASVAIDLWGSTPILEDWLKFVAIAAISAWSFTTTIAALNDVPLGAAEPRVADDLAEQPDLVTH